MYYFQNLSKSLRPLQERETVLILKVLVAVSVYIAIYCYSALISVKQLQKRLINCIILSQMVLKIEGTEQFLWYIKCCW